MHCECGCVYFIYIQTLKKTIFFKTVYLKLNIRSKTSRKLNNKPG